ncbi:MAG: hypothetical protein Q9220_001824 [cf. Caloplaca sp. 1 TL-2023]
MRAWQYTTTSPGGLPANLSLNSSAPLPQPKPSQHLIRILHVALNPVDYKPAEIAFVTRFLITKPATPGIDFCGRVVIPATVGNTEGLKEGDLVYGCAGTSPFAGGALREYAVSGVDSTVKVPENVGKVDAATIGVAGITAYQSLVPFVKAGERVLINGGSGGTGVFGIQFAKAVGCHVTTTCSGRNVGLVKGLGADEVIDYVEEKERGGVLGALRRKGEKFDHVVDNVGSDSEFLWYCHEYLKPGKRCVLVGASPSWKALGDGMKRGLWPSWLGGMKGKVAGFWPKQKVENFKPIGEWMAEGKVKAVVDERFAFEDAVKAFEKLKTGRAKGKIVIDVAPEI